MTVVRTTLTLENELDERIREISFREKKPYKQVVNEVLRRGLGVMSPAIAKQPFRVKPFSFALPAELDARNYNHLAEELEDERILAGLRKDSAKDE